MTTDQITTRVDVQDLPAMTVACIRHSGAYKGNEALFGQLFGRLMEWAGARGLVKFPETQLLSIYEDETDTDDEPMTVTVALTIPPETTVDGDIGKMTVPAGRYAVARFELDADKYGEAWNYLFGEWLPASGYQPAGGPALEIYRNDPQTHPEGKHIVDICLPVKPV